MEVSPSKNYVVYTTVIQSGEHKTEELYIAVFDEKFNLVWSKVQEFDYKDKVLGFDQAVVSDNGKVFLLMSHTNAKDSRIAKDRLNYSYKVFEVEKENLKEHNIDLGENRFAKELGLYCKTGSSNCTASGFYKDNFETKEANGVFYATVGDKGIKNIKYNAFEKLKLEDAINSKNKDTDAVIDIYDLSYFQDNTIGIVTGRPSSDIDYLRHEFSTKFFVTATSSQAEGVKLAKPMYKYWELGYTHFIKTYTYTHDGKIYILYKENGLRRVKPASKLEVVVDTKLVVLSSNGTILSQDTILTMKEDNLASFPSVSIADKDKILLGFSRGRHAIFGILDLK